MITVQVKGLDKLAAQLKNLGPEGKKAVNRTIEFYLQLMRTQVIDSLGTDGKTGIVYHAAGRVSKKTGRRGKGHDHQASAPGEAPSSDTGQLRKGIHTDFDSETGVGRLVSSAPYSADLELGTSKMAARPFLVPVFEANREQINKTVRILINQAIKDNTK